MRLLGLNPALLAPPELVTVFEDGASVQAMLDVEAALARAEERCGVIPAGAAAPIVAACRAELYDLDAIAAATRLSGTAAVPLVKMLGARAPGGWAHFGATSQDVLDTALVLQLRRAVALLSASAERLRTILATLAHTHAATPMLGRTLLQPGPPITFGLKVAGWLGAVDRGAERLRGAGRDAAVLQFGGAVGTLASLGEHGPAVADALGAELDLLVPPAPWHGARDRTVALAAALAGLGATCGKMARDLSLMMQAELAEVAEPVAAGRGGSSTMPHKRNPVGCVSALAAAHRLPGLLGSVLAGAVVEHERGAGPWQAEAAAMAEICLATGAALAAMEDVCGGLSVDPAAMAADIAALRGLVLAERLMLALAPVLGRDEAHHLVEALVGRCRDGGTLQDAAAAEPRVTAAIADLPALFDPAGYLGATATFIARSLERPAERPSGEP